MDESEKAVIERFGSKLNRSVGEKSAELQQNSRLKHIVFSGQLDRKLISRLIRNAQKIEILQRKTAAAHDLTNMLREKRAILYFSQPSTRTYTSFVAACQLLGINYVSFRDSGTSSSTKGESLIDSIRMFSTYNDVIIMRSPIPNLAESSAYLMNELAPFNGGKTVHIINGGAGTDEHPTQALLDIFTISQGFDFNAPSYSCNGKSFSELKAAKPDLMPGLDGKHFCFVGDLGRGRTVHSLISLLSLYKDVRLSFVSPEIKELMLPEETKRHLQHAGVQFQERDSFDGLIEDVDMLYVTRRQNEYNSEALNSAIAAVDFDKYVVNRALVERMQDHAIVMHPMPRNDELSTCVDNNFRAKYFEQARNGMWIRAALLCHLFDVEDALQEIFESHGYSTYREQIDLR